MKLKTIYYLNGTHWDREWYKSFQGFRYMLMDVLDEVIDTPGKGSEFSTVYSGWADRRAGRLSGNLRAAAPASGKSDPGEPDRGGTIGTLCRMSFSLRGKPDPQSADRP